MFIGTLTGSTSQRDTWLIGVFRLRVLYVPINDLAKRIYNRDIHQIYSRVITPTRWFAVFLTEVINTTHTRLVIFDNIWTWDRYFGALSCYSTCNCWYFITFLKTCTKTTVTPRLSTHFTATTLLTYRKSMLPFLISLSFIIAMFFRSLRAVPRLLKLFWRIKKVNKAYKSYKLFQIYQLFGYQ